MQNRERRYPSYLVVRGLRTPSALIHHFGPVTEEQALTFLKDSYRNIPIPPWEMDKLISIVKEAFANEKGWDNDVWSRYYNKCMKEESGGGH